MKTVEYVVERQNDRGEWYKFPWHGPYETPKEARETVIRNRDEWSLRIVKVTKEVVK